MKADKKATDAIDPSKTKAMVGLFSVLLTKYQDDPEVASAAATALGSVPGKKLVESPEFISLLQRYVNDVLTGDSEKQKRAVRALAEIVKSGDKEVLEEFAKAGGVAALFLALNTVGEDPVTRKHILDQLNAFASKEYEIG